MTYKQSDYNSGQVQTAVALTDEEKETLNITLTEDVYVVQVRDNPGVSLPNTGGFGNMKFTVAGAIMILTALCFGCAFKRRERRFDF